MVITIKILRINEKEGIKKQKYEHVSYRGLKRFQLIREMRLHYNKIFQDLKENGQEIIVCSVKYILKANIQQRFAKHIELKEFLITFL